MKFLLKNRFLECFCDLNDSSSAVLEGLEIAIPPSLVGKLNSSRSTSFGGGRPESAGNSFVRITFSRGCSSWPIPHIVLDRYTCMSICS